MGIYYCDICGEKRDNDNCIFHSCRQCKRDICDDCTHDVSVFAQNGREEICEHCLEKNLAVRIREILMLNLHMHTFEYLYSLARELLQDYHQDLDTNPHDKESLGRVAAMCTFLTILDILRRKLKEKEDLERSITVDDKVPSFVPANAEVIFHRILEKIITELEEERSHII